MTKPLRVWSGSDADGVEVKAGTPMSSGTVIDLVLGLSNDTAAIVPDLRGKSLRTAVDMAQDNSLNVGRLRRTAIGGLRLGMLKPGEWRELTKDELRSLRTAVGKSAPQRGGKGGRK